MQIQIMLILLFFISCQRFILLLINRTILAFAIAFLLPFSLSLAQNEPSRSSISNNDIVVKEGLYIDYLHFKANSPIRKESIKMPIFKDQVDFWEKLVIQQEIIYIDAIGTERKVSPLNIWGYSRNGFVFINVSGSFSRITVLGSISHFVANMKVANSANYDPMLYSPYYGGAYQFGMLPTPQTSNELRQLMLEFESGRLLEYNITNLEDLLKMDSVLYNEFTNLSKRKKKQLKFVYLRKFNEKYPIVFEPNKK